MMPVQRPECGEAEQPGAGGSCPWCGDWWCDEHHAEHVEACAREAEEMAELEAETAARERREAAADEAADRAIDEWKDRRFMS